MNILEKKIEEIAFMEAANRDCLVARYLLETGYKPSEIELVSQHTPDGYKFFCQKRQQVPTQGNQEKLTTNKDA